MKKILDFIIIFLLVFLIMQYINGNNKQEINEIKQGTIVLKTIKKSYSVPAGIKLIVENKTKEDRKINVCKDLTIKYTNTDSFVDLGNEFCDNNVLNIKSGSKAEIDYGNIYNKFKEKGLYVVKYIDDSNKEKQIITTSFEIESRGTFTKLFIYLFYAPAYNLIIFLVKIFSGSFGLAIITITVILRLLLLWPQHKMLVSQKRLQELQPKIKKIQEEFKGQPQVLGQKMMELYKTEKVNPMGSCGFMLIQMPILLVIYNVILNITDQSNHYYLFGFLKDFDFSTMSYSFMGIDLLNKAGVVGIILGITVGVLQFIQIKLSQKNQAKTNNNLVLEKKKGASDYSQMMPDPEKMQKIMLYGMPAMVAVFTYNFPAGLGLYWGITTLFMILQQLIVNKKKK